MHCRHTFHPHDARLGIDRYFGELNAAKILTRNVHGASEAKAAIIVAALGNGADYLLVEETGRLPETDVARGAAARKIRPWQTARSAGCVPSAGAAAANSFWRT